MNRFLLAITFCWFHFVVIAQQKMKPVEELINAKESAWPMLQKLISKAKNKVDILPCDTVKAKEALYHTQVTTRSPMGSIVFETGGILIDSGWIRILGSGSSKLNRSLPDWNKGKSFKNFGDKASYYLVADDAVGGFYAINGGIFGQDLGKVYYLSPDDLEWESLEFTYTEFINFCFNGDLALFYKEPRWKDWSKETLTLAGDKIYTFFPFLWSKEGEDINKTSRKIIPVEEHFFSMLDMRKQLGLSKNGL
jgi:hypothetical protein